MFFPFRMQEIGKELRADDGIGLEMRITDLKVLPDGLDAVYRYFVMFWFVENPAGLSGQ